MKKRRILWIWGTVPSGIQAIPRELTYHPGLKQIVYTPAAEMLQLRRAEIEKLGAVELQPNAAPTTLKAAGAADLELNFTLSENTTLSVAIGGGEVFARL